MQAYAFPWPLGLGPLIIMITIKSRFDRSQSLQISSLGLALPPSPCLLLLRRQSTDTLLYLDIRHAAAQLCSLLRPLSPPCILPSAPLDSPAWSRRRMLKKTATGSDSGFAFAPLKVPTAVCTVLRMQTSFLGFHCYTVRVASTAPLAVSRRGNSRLCLPMVPTRLYNTNRQ